MVLRIERTSPGVVDVILSRPESLNALDASLMAELYRALEQIGRSPDDRVVVLTGEGRAFCAGQDIRNFGDGLPSTTDGPATLLRFQEYMSRIVVRVRDLPQPVIAAVNGVAVGAGFALACASDIRVASVQARFGTGAVRLGLSGCEMGLSYHLPRLVGMSAAAEWMLTGRLVDAETALRTGLVSRVVAAPDLLATAHDLASAILANSPFGVRMTKRVMWDNVEASSLLDALDLEDRTQVVAVMTKDAEEARAALLEKRPARFTDS
jgi:enoyl-CoA hydratase/carnithine racemase